MGKLQKKNTALLIIDLQNGFCSTESQMGMNVGVESQQKVIPHLQEALKFFRENDLPVFWSQQVHFEQDMTRARKKLNTHFKKQKFTPCLNNTNEPDFYPPAKKLMVPQDQIITKHRASVFFDTNFETRLRMLGIDNLVIAGCNTEFCVAHTVRDAYARDYELIILEDCVAGIKEEYHELCLKMFADYFAVVAPSAELANFFEENV